MESRGDGTIVRYRTISNGVSTVGLLPNVVIRRTYSVGRSDEVAGKAGPAICSYYATGKFLPGTTVRWEPSVSFTTSGRVFVGFTDNPEVMEAMNLALNTYYLTPTTATYNTIANLVKSLGDVRSFPIWQETEIPFPTRTRRKRFDSNVTIGLTDVNQLDRSAQTTMYAAFEGLPTPVGSNTDLGVFGFRDVVDVEGISSVLT